MSYTGIGGSPTNRNGASAGCVRQGLVSLKEDGTFASWIWKAKWLVLKEAVLEVRKSEVRVVRGDRVSAMPDPPPRTRPSSRSSNSTTSPTSSGRT